MTADNSQAKGEKGNQAGTSGKAWQTASLQPAVNDGAEANELFRQSLTTGGAVQRSSIADHRARFEHHRVSILGRSQADSIFSRLLFFFCSS